MVRLLYAAHAQGNEPICRVMDRIKTVERLYHARRSATIHDEWTRNLAKDRPELAAKLPLVVERMNASVPDCLVTNYEKLAGSIELPDPDDRHVVAAAIVGHADANLLREAITLI